MAFLRYGMGILSCLILLSSPQSFAQSRACQLAEQGINFSNSILLKKTGADSRSDSAFHPLKLYTYAEAVQKKLQQSLQEDCAFTQKIEYRKQLLSQPNPPPYMPQLNEYEQQMHFRIYGGGKQTMDGPNHQYRREPCLNGWLPSKIKEISAICSPAVNGIKDVCDQSQALAHQASEQTAKDIEQSKKRDLTGALQFARKQQKKLAHQLINLRSSNMSCHNALTSLDINGCTEILSNTFTDEKLTGFIARGCTHDGFSHNVSEIVRYLQAPDSPPQQIRNHMEAYRTSRQVEATIAKSLEDLTIIIQQLEPQQAERDVAHEQ